MFTRKALIFACLSLASAVIDLSAWADPDEELRKENKARVELLADQIQTMTKSNSSLSSELGIYAGYLVAHEADVGVLSQPIISPSLHPVLRTLIQELPMGHLQGGNYSFLVRQAVLQHYLMLPNVDLNDAKAKISEQLYQYVHLMKYATSAKDVLKINREYLAFCSWYEMRFGEHSAGSGQQFRNRMGWEFPWDRTKGHSDHPLFEGPFENEKNDYLTNLNNANRKFYNQNTNCEFILNPAPDHMFDHFKPASWN